MKKVSGLIFILFMITIFPISALAVDYSIEEMNIDASLQKNGNVQVTEQQTYRFDSEFNGITRTLIPKENTKITQLKASENEKALKVEQDENTYKIHRKGKEETITVELNYLIEDGVSVYSDVGEFYWSFFDTNNESDYEHFDVTVHPPEPTSDVIAFGYDSAANHADVKENGRVLFDLGHVSSGEKGDIRVAYDAALFSSAPLTENRSMREDIEAEKESVRNELIAFENRQKTLNNIAPYITGLLALILLGLLFFAYQKKQAIVREVNRKYSLPYFVPEEVMSLPATIFYMKSDMVQPEVLSAALMDLIRQGYVEEIDEESFQVISRETTYNHELILIEWLFDEVGNDGSFKAEDLEKYTKVKKNQKTYQKDYLKWQKAVREEKKTYKLYIQNIKTRLVTGAIGFLIIPFIGFLAVYELFMFMTFNIFIALGYLVFASLYKTKTMLGTKIKRDWQAFQTKYPELADKEWDELTTDDQKRAFIYGIGIKDKKIKEKNDILLNRYEGADFATSNPVNMLFFATVINSSFNNAQSTSAASSSSAGGGTGVGGGGGGSGAF